MKKKKDILSRAVEALAKQPIPPGPPQQTAERTLETLAQVAGELNTAEIPTPNRTMRGKTMSSFAKVAAAAVLLICAGYAVGRLSAPPTPDIEKLRVTLEESLKPAVRDELLDEMKQYVRVGMAAGYVRIRDEIDQQYRRDLDDIAVQTLAASSAVTHQLLQDLIQSINTAQFQDRRWVTAALRRLEFNQAKDRAKLSNGLQTLAYRTGGELLQTRNDMAQLVSFFQPENETPDEQETPE